MAAQPICIITPTGLKCLSSPIKQHLPTGGECTDMRADPNREGLVKAIGVALSKSKTPTISSPKREVILRVVELMLAANVCGDTPFTIVKGAKSPPSRRRR